MSLYNIYLFLFLPGCLVSSFRYFFFSFRKFLLVSHLALDFLPNTISHGCFLFAVKTDVYVQLVCNLRKIYAPDCLRFLGMSYET